MEHIKRMKEIALYLEKGTEDINSLISFKVSAAVGVSNHSDELPIKKYLITVDPAHGLYRFTYSLILGVSKEYYLNRVIKGVKYFEELELVPHKIRNKMVIDNSPEKVKTYLDNLGELGLEVNEIYLNGLKKVINLKFDEYFIIDSKEVYNVDNE